LNAVRYTIDGPFGLQRGAVVARARLQRQNWIRAFHVKRVKAMTEYLDIDLLQLSDHRPARFVPRPSIALLRRMESHGAVDPVVVRPAGAGRYEILSHPDIWVAAGELSIAKVPAIIREDIDDLEAADIVRDHYVSAPDDPISEAEGFLTVMQRNGWWDGRSAALPRGAISKVARSMSRSRPYVANSLRLLKLPVGIQEELRGGRLSMGQARPLLRLSSRADQLGLARRIKAERLTARQAELEARTLSQGRPPRAPEQTGLMEKKSADIVRLERRVTDLLGAEFRLDEGRAVINYYGDLSILDGILERIGYRG